MISGTGRDGTTFLVQLFTAPKFNTGFELSEAKRNIDPVAMAGLEKTRLADPDNPYVIKSPWHSLQMATALGKSQIWIRLAIVPVRDLGDAVASRVRVHNEVSSRGLPTERAFGGLWGTQNPAEQKSILAKRFYRLIQALVHHQIPILFLDFPRVVHDQQYCWHRLKDVLCEHGVGEAEFAQAFAATSDPSLVHKFSR